MKTLHNEKGFSLMEILIASVLIAAMAVTYISADLSMNKLVKDDDMYLYTSARNQLEQIYDKVSTDQWGSVPAWSDGATPTQFDIGGGKIIQQTWAYQDVPGRDYRQVTVTAQGNW